MNKRDMKKHKDALVALKEKLGAALERMEEDTLKKSQRDLSGDLSGYSLHMADVATDNFDREFALSLLANEQDIMYEMDEALERIQSGTYGDCELCSKPILEKRLKAIPYARNCTSCQEKEEKKKRRK
jgi:DnaK suppressor protein